VLSQDEINALLRLIKADELHLSQDEINELRRVISAKPRSEPKSPRPWKTEVLSQDEINQILRAIGAGDDDQ
jgi:flagellar motor switch protein FliM